jgi:hypothetical protein
MKSGIVCFLTMVIGLFYPWILFFTFERENETDFIGVVIAVVASGASLLFISILGLLLDVFGSKGKILGYCLGLAIALSVYNYFIFYV